MEKRFFVDKRIGCIAIRDRQHPEFDADREGLDSETPDVVEFEMATYKAGGWDLSENIVRRFKEKCLALNDLFGNSYRSQPKSQKSLTKSKV